MQETSQSSTALMSRPSFSNGRGPTTAPYSPMELGLGTLRSPSPFLLSGKVSFSSPISLQDTHSKYLTVLPGLVTPVTSFHRFFFYLRLDNPSELRYSSASTQSAG